MKDDEPSRVARVTFMSNRMQNSILKILPEEIRSNILKEVKDAQYFSIIIDTTTDISKQEQFSVVIRYARVDYEKNEVEIVESLIALEICTDATSNGMFILFKGLCKKHGIDWRKNLVGQTYDGANSMRGQYGGLRTLVQNENPRAIYITAQITEVDEGLIRRYEVILTAGHNSNAEAFEEYAAETAASHVELYGWYYMTISVHKVLIHGADVIRHCKLPLGIFNKVIYFSSPLNLCSVLVTRKCKELLRASDIPLPVKWLLSDEPSKDDDAKDASTNCYKMKPIVFSKEFHEAQDRRTFLLQHCSQKNKSNRRTGQCYSRPV
ncbi:hypothetical protein V9T40_012682 [Parthenolecanium corni]|uniref:DUF4371 domain-containing protein n=1 Tax=Parthenolecanium corni TaxID=536013 RepID=A0AAN9TNK4_9HEMI